MSRGTNTFIARVFKYEYVYSESIYTTLMSHSDGDESCEYVYSESI